jgi:hypothetical protein
MIYRLQNAPFFQFALHLPRACVFKHVEVPNGSHSLRLLSHRGVSAIPAIAVITTGVSA